MVGPNSMSFNITNYTSSSVTKGDAFADALKQSLDRLAEVARAK
jgi:hypothetical protein